MNIAQYSWKVVATASQPSCVCIWWDVHRGREALVSRKNRALLQISGLDIYLVASDYYLVMPDTRLAEARSGRTRAPVIIGVSLRLVLWWDLSRSAQRSLARQKAKVWSIPPISNHWRRARRR